MKKLLLKTGTEEGVSELIVGKGVFESVLPEKVKAYSNAFFFTDENVYGLYGERLKEMFPQAPIFVMPAGEEYKTQETLFSLLSEMAKAGLHRTACLVAFGGGVVGDIGGLASSLYMRGIDCIQVPTTLLAQVDSSVGGKTAVDFAGVKNLIGAFHQPEVVLADGNFLNTLPQREIRCGLGEIIKHGALSSALYEKLLKNKERLFNLDFLSEVVFDNVAFKASVVEQDAKEAGLRKSLNLGHTTAHALELSQKTLSHGEYVLLGTIFEAEMAKSLKNSDKEYLDELQSLAKYALGGICELPDLKEASALALLDKKNVKSGEIVITAPVRKGEYELLSVPFERYAEELVKIGGALC